MGIANCCSNIIACEVSLTLSLWNDLSGYCENLIYINDMWKIPNFIFLLMPHKWVEYTFSRKQIQKNNKTQIYVLRFWYLDVSTNTLVFGHLIYRKHDFLIRRLSKGTPFVLICIFRPASSVFSHSYADKNTWDGIWREKKATKKKYRNLTFGEVKCFLS